jgi:hypothetical protein
MRIRDRFCFVLCAGLFVAGALTVPPLPTATAATAATAATTATTTAPQMLSEAEKIEALLRIVDGLKDAVFIRNGSEHDGRAAAKHLRSKWNSQRDVIKTARDFVLHLASRSSLSGKRYLLRWKNGQLQTSESFLLTELKKLEQG